MKIHVKKNDIVRVITGDDKGKTGRIIKVNVKTGRVKVQGVSIATKHYKAQKQGEKSSLRLIEQYIDASNVTKVEQSTQFATQ